MQALGPHSNPLLDSSNDEPSMSVTLGRNVQRLRERQRINKTRFAAMVGIGRPLLNKIENGTSNIRLSLVQELADALETSAEDLLFDASPLGSNVVPRTARNLPFDPRL